MPNSTVLLHRINNHHVTSSDTPPFFHHKQDHHHHSPTTTSSTPTTSSSDNLEIPDDVVRYHTQTVGPNQCSSAVVQEIQAPPHVVWSVVRRFNAPQVYKHFVRSCDIISSNGDVGILHRVRLVSGLHAATSNERLEILDNERHVISFSVVDGDHRLSNYRSVTSLHAADVDKTVVVESYVVDIPVGNTKEETCVFVDGIVRCNLHSLAQIAEKKNINNNVGSS